MDRLQVPSWHLKDHFGVEWNNTNDFGAVFYFPSERVNEWLLWIEFSNLFVEGLEEGNEVEFVVQSGVNNKLVVNCKAAAVWGNDMAIDDEFVIRRESNNILLQKKRV